MGQFSTSVVEAARRQAERDRFQGITERIVAEGLDETAVEPEGRKDDGGKPPMELLDRAALEGLASVMGFGRTKYGANQWRQGFKHSRLIGAAMRHLMAVADGEDTDAESGLPHVDHAMACLMMLSNMQKTRPDLDDRYKG